MSDALASKLKAEGNKLFGQGDFRSAVVKYTEAIDLSTKNPVLYSNRAAAYLNLKDWKKVIDDCDTGIRLVEGQEAGNFKSLTVKLLCRKAIGLRNCGETESASKCIDDALLKDPKNDALEKESQIIQGIRKRLKTDEVSKNANSTHLVSIEINEVDDIPSSFFNTKLDGSKNIELIESSSLSKSIPSYQTSNHDFPTNPTVQFLSNLKFQPQSKVSSCYHYVLNVHPEQYKSIYKVTGLEPEFLNYFLDACIYALQHDEIQYEAKITGLLYLFKSLPRFSLTSMFADPSKVERLKKLFKSKLNAELDYF